MIICSIITAAVVITVGTIICTSGGSSFATSVPARYDYEKHLRESDAIRKMINKHA